MRASLDSLRDAIARLERSPAAVSRPTLPFGISALDAALPGGGLCLGALHEIIGTGLDIQHAAVPAFFAAGILARLNGPVLWVLERHDLFAPGLASAGLHPDRVLYAETASRHTLLVMEEGLRHRGLAAVVAEPSSRLSLTASRRLLLAAEASGTMALILRRPKADLGPDALTGAIAAMTRWRISPLPSPPPIADAPDVPGLGPAHWQLELLRCRGGRTGAWIVEASNAEGRLALVAPLADRSLWQDARQRRAAA